MDALFGTSFADVRIHVGGEAQAIGAVAFTQGSHIHFAPGAYDPSTPRGHEVLVHELAHVVQQRRGRVQSSAAAGIAVVRDARLDAEARQMAQRTPARAVQRAAAKPAAPMAAVNARPVNVIIQGKFPQGLNSVAGCCRRAGVAQPKRAGGAIQLPPSILRPARAGQCLPPAVQRMMESALGASFTNVRVHVGPDAATLGALAFTRGTDIYFAPGHYNPHTPQGQQLLGHELTHVIQQRSGRVRNPFGSGIAVVEDPSLESEANFKALSVAARSIQAKLASEGLNEQEMMARAWRSDDVWRNAGVFPGMTQNPSAVQCVGFLNYLGNLAVSAGSLLHAATFVTIFRRLPSMLGHLLSGGWGALKWVWEGLKMAVGHGNRSLIAWLTDGLISGAAWVGRLITKVLDFVAIGEVIDFFLQVIKYNSRGLTPAELAAAQIVYQNSISYWKVKVDIHAGGSGALTRLYNAILRLVGQPTGVMIAITAFHTIEIDAAHAGNLNNVVHELGHVKQHETVGSQYMMESVHGALRGGYDYDATTLHLRHLRAFNREQQCRMMEHLWAVEITAPPPAPIPANPAQWCDDYENAVDLVVGSITNFNVNFSAAILAALTPTGDPQTAALSLYQPKGAEFRNGEI
jgi:hypothetical protein